MLTKISQFGKLLRSHMQAVNMSAGRLAKLSGLSRATIYNWISGRSPQPREWQDAILLAKVLELAPSQTDALLKSASFPSETLLQNRQKQPLSTIVNGTLPLFNNNDLIGAQDASNLIVDWFCDPTEQPFISIEGIGGIGKTTLALAVAEMLATQNAFAGILWVSAKGEQLGATGQIEPLENSARALDDVVTRLSERMGQHQWTGLSAKEQLLRLKPLFQHAPHLIVVDNLETVSDVDLLIPALSQLGSSTRILLTSRESLQHFPYVRCYKVPPLSLVDSRKLLEKEVGRRGSIDSISDVQMTRLISLVGGLPLALKLIAAQLSYLPLSIILASFSDSQPASPTQVYQYIYANTWVHLTHSAKKLLFSLLDNSPTGESFEWISMMSGLAQTACSGAVRELLNYSLLEISGILLVGHGYRVHRMTVAFLETQLLENKNVSENGGSWQQHHVDQQSRNLQQLPEWLDENDPDTVAAHLPSILTLFDNCRQHAAFHEQIVYLIELLHPWPVRWGLWNKWQTELKFASTHFQQKGDVFPHQLHLLHEAQLHLRLGDATVTAATCQQIEQVAARNGWIKLWAMAGELHIQALRTLENLSDARVLLEQLEESIGVDVDEVGISAEILIARIHLIWQRMYFLRLDGRVRQAVDLGRRIVEKLSHYPTIDKQIIANSIHTYGVVLWAIDDYPSSLQAIGRARDLYEALGDRIEAITMRDNIGLVYWSMGQLDQAEAAMRDSLNMMREINAQAHVIRLIGNLAVVYMANGEVEQAIHHLEEQKRLAQLSNDQHEFNRADQNLSTMYLCQGRFKELISSKERWLVDEVEPLSQIGRMAALVELSDAYLAVGDRLTAREYVDKADQLRPDIDAICAKIFALRAMAHHHDDSQSHKLLNQAIQLATEANRPLDIAACSLDLIAVSHNDDEKRRHWTRAKEVLIAMHATAWLQGRSINNVPSLPYLF